MSAEHPNRTSDPNDPKDVLRRYLDVAHDAVLWKLDGLSEYDVRRPLTRTGTNLLGVVKHLAAVELEYFGDVFDRPHGVPFPWDDDGGVVNGDMFATVDESRDQILEMFATARRHAAATIAALDLDAEGHVPWWGDAGNPVTLHRILVHMIAEIHRHLGQIDILREGLDGAVGYRAEATNLPDDADIDWTAYCERLERIAVEAGRRAG